MPNWNIPREEGQRLLLVAPYRGKKNSGICEFEWSLSGGPDELRVEEVVEWFRS